MIAFIVPIAAHLSRILPARRHTYAASPVTRNTVPTPTPSSRAMRRIPVPAARAAMMAATLSASLFVPNLHRFFRVEEIMESAAAVQIDRVG
jgi:hypothetical protein